jgi:hypothetical protein
VPARVPLPLVPKVTLRMSASAATRQSEDRAVESKRDTRSLLSSKRPSASTRQHEPSNPRPTLDDARGDNQKRLSRAAPSVPCPCGIAPARR